MAQTSRRGEFHFSNLPVGEYSLHVEARGFVPFSVSSILRISACVISFPVRLEVAGTHNEVSVVAPSATIDLGSTLGNVVSSREAMDLAAKRPQSHAAWSFSSRASQRRPPAFPRPEGSCAADKASPLMASGRSRTTTCRMASRTWIA